MSDEIRGSDVQQKRFKLRQEAMLLPGRHCSRPIVLHATNWMQRLWVQRLGGLQINLNASGFVIGYTTVQR